MFAFFLNLRYNFLNEQARPLAMEQAQLQLHDDLRIAAEAARKSLSVLEDERRRLNLRISELIEPINMLQGVIAAWERLNPSVAKKEEPISASELEGTGVGASVPAPTAKQPRRGEISDRVREVLLNVLTPISPFEVHAEILKRFAVDYNMNAISIAMRRGAERGIYKREEYGKYSRSL